MRRLPRNISTVEPSCIPEEVDWVDAREICLFFLVERYELMHEQ